MTDTTQRKELMLLFGIIMVFALALASLYFYEKKSGFLEKQGHKIFSSFINQ